MFKYIDLLSIDSIWTKAKNNKEEHLAKHNHEGWVEFVNAFCDSEPEDQVAPGVFLTWTNNFDNMYLSQDFESFPERILAALAGKEPLIWFRDNCGKSSYGVCDSVEQFLESDVYKFFNELPYEFVASLVEVKKSEQDSDGGWRWHKWGPYIGKHERKCEYLYDEDGIESVFCFHIILRKP